MRNLFAAIVAAQFLTACAPAPEPPAPPAAPVAPAAPAPAPSALEVVLAAQPEDVQARYAFRHPQETLEFFGIEPGMTVVEALPGGGWYSKILVPYLGAEGQLIGANYPMDMWPRFGFSEERIAAFRTWTTDWPLEAGAWHGEAGASIAAFEFGSMPESMAGTADAVLLIRALHNLARFDGDGGYLTTALQDVFMVLKPGGIVGVVQHEAPADMPADWASGARGYLHRQFVIDRFTAAGFEFVEASEINANPNDMPGADDIVWRLPPTLGTSSDNPELRAQMEAIGESNRMTLRFRKPD